MNFCLYGFSLTIFHLSIIITYKKLFVQTLSTLCTGRYKGEIRWLLAFRVQ